MQRHSLLKIGGSGTEVEVDETFIGGKARNMHHEHQKSPAHRHYWNRRKDSRYLESWSVVDR